MDVSYEETLEKLGGKLKNPCVCTVVTTLLCLPESEFAKQCFDGMSSASIIMSACEMDQRNPESIMDACKLMIPAQYEQLYNFVVEQRANAFKFIDTRSQEKSSELSERSQNDLQHMSDDQYDKFIDIVKSKQPKEDPIRVLYYGP